MRLRERYRRLRAAGRVVDNGRVLCPLDSDVDVERCFLCPHLVRFANADDRAFVVCHPSRPERDQERLQIGF